MTVDLTLAEIERLSGAKKQKQNSDVTLITAILLHSALKEFSCNTGEGRGGFYGSITAKSVAPVSADFDARFSCKWKRYVYYVCTGYNRSPFLARYAWEINHRLDLGKMKEAATFLNGRHNFDWMSVTEEGELRDVFREFELSIEKIQMDNGFSLLGGDNDRQVFKIIGVCDFFLYKMMRRIVGILVAIGRRQVDPSVLKNHLVLRDDIVPSEESSSMPTIPTALSHTAPSKGLCLEHVEYDVPI